ncbi:hypothetical protein C5C67_11965 [Rathayibacter sp. AY1E1]|nr:hypothetical protein C5C67_11965 [Rathayibacter sp. AY1E1]
MHRSSANCRSASSTRKHSVHPLPATSRAAASVSLRNAAGNQRASSRSASASQVRSVPRAQTITRAPERVIIRTRCHFQARPTLRTPLSGQ